MKNYLDDTIDENNDLLSLEDDSTDFATTSNGKNYVYPKPLYHLKLEYSSESLFATTKGALDLKAGDYAIVPTRYGKDMALVLGEPKKPIGVVVEDIVYIVRKANAKDIEAAVGLKQRELDALKVFKEKMFARKLDMKALGVHFLLEEQKVLFFFSAENRVDFRELVKDLVGVFKMRIELRQIGVRDESRIIGGLGVCGRGFCCHTVSDRLRSVSIKMAKSQNLSLNSVKISGQCGRLLCCLAYEADWYSEARKNMPVEGSKIFFDGSNFTIIETNQIRNTVRMRDEDGRVLEMKGCSLMNENGKWKVKKKACCSHSV